MSGSRDLELAEALLADVQRAIDEMVRLDRQHQREKLARSLLQGDLAGAREAIARAQAAGADARAALAHALYCDGTVRLAVAESPEIDSCFTVLFVNPLLRGLYLKAFVRSWAGPAAQSLRAAAELAPGFQPAHYNLGRALFLAGDKPGALQALARAQQGEDRGVTMEAAKMVSRITRKSGPCFVATACYGDFDHPDVAALRRWRDEALLPTPAGRCFVRLYYAAGPALARALARHPRLAAAVRRRVLAPLVRKVAKTRRGGGSW